MKMSQDTIVDYPKDLTLEKVWATIQENHQKFLERDKKFQDDLDKLTAQYNDLLERNAKEKQEQQKVEEEKRKVEDEKMSKLDIQMDEFGNRFGELAEHLVAPNIAKRFNELGYNFDRVIPNGLTIKDGQVSTGVDIWFENPKTIAVVAVESKPTKQDINKHLKRMTIARQYVDRRGNTHKSLIGVIAGAIFPNEVKKVALEVGFYVITQSGDTVKIEVPKDFKPRIF
jgi:hypothetical protein